MPIKTASRQPEHNRLAPDNQLPTRANTATTAEGDPNFVLSLSRGLQVIETFEGHTEGQTAADIARRTGFSRAAVRRLLMTLEGLGYAESSGRVYRLTTRVLKLGFSYLSSASLPSLAQPVLEHVTELTHESSSMSVLEDDHIVYVARSGAKRVMSVGLSIGSRLPAYCTSMGRVLLAALPPHDLAMYFQRAQIRALTPKTIVDVEVLKGVLDQVRTNGFALTDEELELGLRAIAVPVRNRRNQAVAAMNIGVHASRVSAGEMIHHLLPILRESARSLGHVLP